uniref:Uncharacterized protein n=1 Tax=viral metagenome TaxID=1070528 RepID=A0A6C0AIY8_9ZZZZ
MPEPAPIPESRRTALLKLKLDMVYRGIETAKAEERFNQNVLPKVPEPEAAAAAPAPAPPK